MIVHRDALALDAVGEVTVSLLPAAIARRTFSLATVSLDEQLVKGVGRAKGETSIFPPPVHHQVPPRRSFYTEDLPASTTSSLWLNSGSLQVSSPIHFATL